MLFPYELLKNMQLMTLNQYKLFNLIIKFKINQIKPHYMIFNILITNYKTMSNEPQSIPI